VNAAPTTAPTWGVWASLWFWLGVAIETLTSRSFSRVLSRRVRGRAVGAERTDAVPPEGGFVLAVNHYHAGLTLDVVAATLLSASRARRGVTDACTVVVGRRAPRHAPTRWRRLVRSVAAAFFRRWSANVLCIPTGGDSPGVGELRAWRSRVADQPVLVFPEGVAGRELGSIRPGAGRWLAGLHVPVIPVGVWWGDAGWNVVFGAPISWSTRRDLRDLQLGLAMAALLPRELAPAWQPLLGRWRQAHDGPRQGEHSAPASTPHGDPERQERAPGATCPLASAAPEPPGDRAPA